MVPARPPRLSAHDGKQAWQEGGLIRDRELGIKNNNTKERRSTFRYSVDWPIVLEASFSTNGQEELGPRTVKVAGKDLSSSGVRILSSRSLEVSELLKLHIPSVIDGVSIPTFAEVRWVNLISSTECMAGLYFIAASIT